MTDEQTKPPLRILHNLARSGGTLISKCLGCMDGIVLLSEIHPLAGKMFNPLLQAKKWHDLITPSDIEQLSRSKGTTYLGAIRLIQQRCAERGLTLIIREWNHLDFIGTPFLEQPTNRYLGLERLSQNFSFIRTAIARNPIDQWLSTRKLEIMKNKLTLEAYMEGYLKYAKSCLSIPTYQYESFADSPEAIFEQICRSLHINYDPSFIDKWYKYKKITGDVSSERGTDTIKRMPRREYEKGLLKQFKANLNYKEAISLAGYEVS